MGRCTEGWYMWRGGLWGGVVYVGGVLYRYSEIVWQAGIWGCRGGIQG